MRRVNTKQAAATFASRNFLAFLAVLLLLPSAARGQEAEVAESSGDAVDYAGKVLVIPVRVDDLDDSRRFRSLRDMLKLANGSGDATAAAAVVFDLNVSAGGGGSEAHRRLLEDLPALEVPTLSYVNPSALGSASILAAGSDAIYMAPAGIIGGAGLVGDGNVENEEAYRRANAQSLSVLKARARSLALSKGHRPEVVEAFIDADAEVRIGDEVISGEGEILTLTADEATRIYEGKPLLAKGVAETVAELLEQEGIEAGIVRQTPMDFLERRDRSRLGTGGTRPSVSSTSESGDEDEDEEPGLFDRRLEGSYAGKILVIEVGDDALATGAARFDFMERTLKKANADGATAVIFDMDTPGGYSWYTNGLVLNTLQDMRVPTFTFVNTRAESAGAIIALGTDAIYMRPAATIGSALTVTTTGDLEGDMKSKVDQMAVAMARNMATLKGHNPDVAEAFVVRNKEVVVDGEVIHPAGEVLNLNSLRATEVYNGRPLLAKGIANSIAEIAEREGLEGEVLIVQPLGMERFAHLVQKFSAVLLLLGLAGAWAELKAPGFGVPGVISLICFGLFFFGNNLAGNLAGYELAVLLVLGLALLAVEIFIVPGTLVAGFVGGLMVLSALVLAMVDRVDFAAVLANAPEAPSIQSLIIDPAFTVSIALAGSVLLLYLMLRYLPDTPAMRWLILKEAVHAGPSLDEAVATSDGAAAPSSSLLGETGEAVTDLRPAGKARFGERLVDITADGEFIDQGTPVKVIRHEGPLVVVESAT